MQQVFAKQAHVTYYARYHIVWIPKYRRNILVRGVDSYCRIKILEVSKWYPDIQFIEVNVQTDHIHALVTYPGTYGMSKVMNIIKSNTSRALREKFAFLKQVYPAGGVWSVGYFYSTVGINEEVIKNYIRNQEKEDKGQAQLEMGL
jgi:putative transposase